MGKVIMSGIVPQLVVPCPYDPVFENNTWEQIIAACQANAVPETWVVGDQKSMTINGTDYLIDIIGKNHDTYASGGSAPLTFQMHDCYKTQYGMSEAGTDTGRWSGMYMRTTILPKIKALMPNEVKSALRTVIKKSLDGHYSNNTSVETTQDDLFLLSEVEIFGTVTFSRGNEGSQYEYYASGNSAIKSINGSATHWYERSPYSGTRWCRVASSGSPSHEENNVALGVSFAFCF